MVEYASLQDLDSRILDEVETELMGLTEGSFRGVILRRHVLKNEAASRFAGFNWRPEVTLEDSISVQHLDSNGIWQPKDCYSIAVAIIEGCAYAKNRGLGSFSDRLPDELATNRQSNLPGCACFDVHEAIGDSQRHFLRIYVAVVTDGPCKLSAHLCQSSAYLGARRALSNWEGYELR
jgi:hypothetical protein